MRAVGIFISEYQKSFTNLGNIDYIFQRTSDGMVTDALFQTMLPQVQTVVRRGAVHNFRPDKPWLEQADKFLELSSGKGFVMLVGDYESGVLDKQAAIDFWCFLCRLEEQRPTKKILFYTAIYILRDNLLKYNGVDTVYGKIDWIHFDMWLARYRDSFNPQTDEPNLTINGVVVREDWAFCQYSETASGPVYGCGSVYVCPDIFNGTPVELDKYLGSADPDIPDDITNDVGELREDLNCAGELINSNTNQLINLDNAVFVCGTFIRKNEANIAFLQGRLDIDEPLIQKAINATEKNTESIEMLWEAGNKSDIYLNKLENAILANDADIDTAFESIDKLKAADLLLDVKVRGLTEGQLEIVEDVIDVENTIVDLPYKLKELENKINGLEGGHNHPKIFYWLGLAK